MNCTLILVSRNLGGQSLVPLFLLPLGIILFMAYYISSTRGNPLPPSVPIAEEVHGSPLWGFVIMLSAVGFLFGAAQAPAPGFWMYASLLFILIFVSGMSAWSGFHYVFTHGGLEITTLGFRLRSIPAEQIERYAVEPWSFFRGYGIRGVGNRRAYVWGNRGVQINTSQGVVYLGHSDPERIVRDLDMIRR